MSILSRKIIDREKFDPKNARHLKSLDYFIQTGNWGDVQFHAELPYIEVPITVLMKYVQHQRKVSRETPDERTARITRTRACLLQNEVPRLATA